MIAEVQVYLKYYLKLKVMKYEDRIYMYMTKKQHFRLTHVKALFTFSSSTNANVTLPWMSTKTKHICTVAMWNPLSSEISSKYLRTSEDNIKLNEFC